MKFKLDWDAIKTGVRTAGSLMFGNAFVAVLVNGSDRWLYLSILLAFGVALIILTSTKKGN